MINWKNIKTESIENINDIVDDAGAVLLDGLTETKIAGVDLQEQCQFNLDNYKLACTKLSEEEDSSLISKANTYLET
jgi:hypothetical protein